MELIHDLLSSSLANKVMLDLEVFIADILLPTMIVNRLEMKPNPKARLAKKRAATTAQRRKVAVPSHSRGKEVADMEIGVRLKHARLVKGLRLRELAATLDCSESFLSKVENDKVRPSLAMLHKIVGALGINIPQLFSGSLEPPGAVQLVHVENRPIIRTGPFGKGPGILIERLIAASRTSLLEANVHCVEPGGHTDGVYTHEGEEIGYVLEGQLELQVDGTWYLCKEGDSFFFRSNLPHGYRNTGRVITKVLWVNTPATF
jgi:transcriptional regulator with XRE-family HTH domain